MDGFDRASVRRTYDAVAEDYAVAFADELDRLPLDRSVLDELASRARGVVLDIGCGPGQVGAYLADLGARVVGCDLSPGMLSVARRRYPHFPLVASDVCNLALATASVAAAVAFYSLHHLPRSDLPVALGELRRVIEVGGSFVACTHLGDGDLHLSELLGHRVDAGAALYGAGEFVGAIEAAGFAIDKTRERGPAPGEAATTRVYVTARAA